MRPKSVQFLDSQIEMAHGAGGKSTRRLVEGLLLPLLRNPSLEELSDSALLRVESARLAFTSDSFVVRPLVFPGGSIGRLAVNGTLNDLAVAGARPVALQCTLILEAGLPSAVLRAEIEALAAAAREAGVWIVGGDTKVVEHGKADGMYITTCGIGCVDHARKLGWRAVKPGDRLLVSGPVGDHGITVLLARGDLDLDAELKSDTRSVFPLVEALMRSGAEIRWMRDPTRGGVASALNELTATCGLAAVLDERALPVRDPVRGACEVLGLDPLQIACEGQFLAVVDPAGAERALEALRKAPGGAEAALIGEIRPAPPGAVLCETDYGGSRLVDMPVGDPLPRIC